MLDELAAAIGRHHTGLHSITPVPRLSIVGADQPIQNLDMMYEPMICFVAAGAKRTTTGDFDQVVGAGQMFLSSLDLPVSATFQVPYRSAVLHLDSRVLADLVLELGDPAPERAPDPRGLITGVATPELIDAVTRWVRLLDTPADIRVLAGRFETEILYRLLAGPLGPMLRQFTLADSRVARARAAAAFIRSRFAEPLTVDAIAGAAHLSVASLHRHFKAATGMSPLQYQKRLRLLEARRMLLAGDITAAAAAASVGYLSATQFNREYRRTYGIPPAADTARRRVTAL
jgi:AraC-like DNA-binding protein